jgi:isopenicillin N synthase-like dioxygenase
VPVIDIDPFFAEAAGQAEVARRVDESLRRLGFLVVTGHGADLGVLNAAAAAARRFFALPLTEKLEIANVRRGYCPAGTTALSYLSGRPSPPDLRESFGIGPETLGNNLWPRRPESLRRCLTASYAALDAAMLRLLHVFAGALSLPLDFFDEKFQGHNITLRTTNYPPLEGTPLPGQLRCGEHTDFTALTLLAIEDERPNGLQVLLKDGVWIDVAAPRGALVVNVGDLLMHWTNDIWISNKHRVLNPPGGANEARQSMAFFANPRDEVVIECIDTCLGPGDVPRYSPITSGEYQERQMAQHRRDDPVTNATLLFEAP